MPAHEEPVRRPAQPQSVRIGELLFRLRALVALLVLMAVFTALSPAFLSSGNS